MAKRLIINDKHVYPDSKIFNDVATSKSIREVFKQFINDGYEITDIEFCLLQIVNEEGAYHRLKKGITKEYVVS